MKVLIVDDSLPNALLIEDLLRKLDFVYTVVFTDPVKALNWAAVETPDLLVLDYIMPDIDGSEFLKRFQSIERNQHVPVVVVTIDDKQSTLHDMLEAGATDFVRKPVDEEELVARCRNLLRMRSYQGELQKTVERLHVMATIDSLTGACNRRHFLDRLETEVARAQRFNEPLSIAMLDADHFKSINDTYGHAVGDDVLRALTRACVEMLRRHDIVGRLGGEEFAICMPETTMDKAQIVCDRLRQNIAGLNVKSHDNEVKFTVSMGVTQYSRGGDSTESFMSRADAALYQAKNQGRNQVILSIADENGNDRA
ncbi:diguanylate cyclase [Hwanghaeella grinnelliae]|uniref:diguanylate cyclase n=1 Tax=Hwanghaeella grinnelliae TaxID=2500179 RepID=A0A3S2Z8N6_9PROT|nr:diguanylate cyclase [Hwanghaeella grinnelliae]RVU37909.1 diguanylate cyclase [Hwanghaeella grinnelliae]